jgi:sugar O-acyltransferase (sialic acid O-acetyltransferase NeuD family)
MKKKKDIYIFGAGGLAREIYLLLQELPEYKFLAFIDKECQRNEVIKCNGQLLPVISESVFDESIEKNNNINAVIPIGFPKLLCKIKNKYCDKCNFPNIIHPSVKLNNGFKIGKGNIISANNVFTDNVRVGSFNVFNIGSLVGHDVTFGDCNVINSSCNISGNVTIGSYNLIGVRSVILQGKSIGDHNIVGAGSVLIRKLTDNTTVFGVPAIKI